MTEQLPHLITDLTLILVLAGVVTVVFKRLKQPLVLGYIVAGFLVGPKFNLFPSVFDEEVIKVWSQIGIIFLLFSLGLEFSFKRILKGGIAPIFTACFIMFCLLVLGALLAGYWHWPYIQRLYMGGMLCMSSTTIIYKAYTDMGLSNKRFAGKVLSVLVLEDILGILLMVFLSTFGKAEGGIVSQMTWELVKLVVMLLGWFLVGIWLIPSFLRKNSFYINKETLVIVSIGLCFLMVVIANHFGYSYALGAFMMGSILAETIEAERISASISSIKDLFGAIFFVSVGMMVDPHLLIEHWAIILLLVLTVVLGQMIFGSLGFLLSGSSLGDAIQSGFSMIQIGEFSFILATMGQDILPDYIYPVVVAVSIITTFLTPYFIKMAMSLNMKTIKKSAEKKEEKKKEKEEKKLSAWNILLREYAGQTLVYSVLSFAFRFLFFIPLLSVSRRLFTHWPGNAVCGIITLAIYSIFLRPLVMRKMGGPVAKEVRNKGFLSCFCFYLLFVLRYAIACAFIYFVLDFISPFRWYYHILVSMVIVFLYIKFRKVKVLSQKLEDSFLYNLRRRDEYLLKNEHPDYARNLKGSDLHITRLTLPEGTQWAGKTLAQLYIGGKNGVHVTAIIRNHNHINIPGGGTMLFPNDTLEVLGDDSSIDLLKQRMESECIEERPTEDSPMRLQRIIVSQNSAMEGMFIKHSGIRDQYRCMVVGFEDAEGNLSVSSADHKITHGDVMWIAGEYNDVAALKAILCQE